VSGASCADNAFDPGVTRRLDPLASAAAQQHVANAICAELDRADIVLEPRSPALFVGDRRLAKAKRVANLRPVVLDRAARPVVAA